ncbi:MAG: TRAP transporter large permease subunit [Deltaproteobacteria bacterium]|nr:TRAP transporter large permease subunit [Deltaproteobacteria bacterium]
MDKLNKAIRVLDKVGVFCRWTNIVGISILFLMTCLIFMDVFLRYGFSSPIRGAMELSEVMLIVVVFFGIAHTQNEKGHVTMDLVVFILPSKARLVMEGVTILFSLGIFVILVWRNLIQTMWFAKTNALHSHYIPIPSAPFAAVIVLGSALMALLLLRDYLQTVHDGIKERLAPYQWIIFFGIPIIAIIFSMFWLNPKLIDLDRTAVGIIGALFSLILIFTGMPIAIVLILTSFLFIGNIRGLNSALNLLETLPYRTTGTFSWVVVAFFVLMGYFCLHARFGEDLYGTAHKWFGHLRGGMAIATIGAGTGFAAIVGDSLSTTVTIGAVALPEMKKFNYDDRLCVGSVAAGASIGPIIPPSVTFIIFGLLAQVSIGKLFIAGIIPGFILAGAFIIVINIWCRINPSLAPPSEKSEWRERLISLKSILPIILLFILVIGGIYLGVFTPSEGGSIGAVGAVVIAVILKRFTWTTFKDALLGAGKIISMAFLILNGAVMFTRFAAWCNLPNTVEKSITGLGLSPIGVALVILTAFFLLGFVIDIMPLLLIGVPILYPVAMAGGLDPIWFGVLVVLVINLGMMTPPVGINLFALKGVAREVPIGTIYWGAMPFILASTVVVAIIFIFPSLATWLPNVLR